MNLTTNVLSLNAALCWKKGENLACAPVCHASVTVESRWSRKKLSPTAETFDMVMDANCTLSH